jgi:hypothetical protein
MNIWDEALAATRWSRDMTQVKKNYEKLVALTGDRSPLAELAVLLRGRRAISAQLAGHFARS